MDGYLGEIRMFAGGYAPAGWHICDGTLLPLNEYQALFALFGTIWGGDGRTTVGLPDLRGRVPVGQDYGPGLTARVLGEKGGASTVQITTANMPTHTHTLQASTTTATTVAVDNNVGLATPHTLATGQVACYMPASLVTDPATQVTTMAGTAITGSGAGGQPHINVMPYLAINYIICIQGMYPDHP